MVTENAVRCISNSTQRQHCVVDICGLFTWCTNASCVCVRVCSELVSWIQASTAITVASPFVNSFKYIHNSTIHPNALIYAVALSVPNVCCSAVILAFSIIITYYYTTNTRCRRELCVHKCGAAGWCLLYMPLYTHLFVRSFGRFNWNTHSNTQQRWVESRHRRIYTFGMEFVRTHRDVVSLPLTHSHSLLFCRYKNKLC